MHARNVLIILQCSLIWLSGCAVDAQPTSASVSIAGALGTIEFKPADWQPGQTTWWIDADGLAPGVAGCHLGTDGSGEPNGRMFGEACLTGGVLVESNSAANELHRHSDDTQYPETLDCNAWCIGEGASGGTCQIAAAPPCAQSAVCICN